MIPSAGPSDRGNWGCDPNDLRSGADDPHNLACGWLGCWKGDSLPFGGDLLRLGWRLNGGHCLTSLTQSDRHGIYYQCLSVMAIQTRTEGLTLYQNILACLLVPLALTTYLVVQTIACMPKSLALLTSQNMFCQLSLGLTISEMLNNH